MRSALSRWGWPLAVAAATAGAVAIAVSGPGLPAVEIYPTTDFTRLPVSVASLAVQAPQSCASIQQVGEVSTLVDQRCGSPASTYRVLNRVAATSQCVRDVDLTYTWTAGGKSGVACLDYDWVAGQCLHISQQSVLKVNCLQRGAVQPQMAVIGAVDVSYCKEGGIAHRARHFTICTLSGDKDCKGKPRGT